MSYWTANPRTLGLPIFSKPLHPLAWSSSSFSNTRPYWRNTLSRKVTKIWEKFWWPSSNVSCSNHRLSQMRLFLGRKNLCRSKNRFEPKCLKSYWKPPSSCFGLDTASINQSGPGLPVRERESRGQDKWVCLMMTWHIPCQPEIDFAAAAAAPSLKTALKLRPQRCVTWVLWLQLRWLSI